MRTVCKAAVFLALSALLAMPALADETPGQKAVREAREATAAECEEVVFSLLSYSRYFDLDAMIGFPVHGFRQNNPATAYREAGSLDGIKNRFQELWYITLPMMAPHLMLSAVLAITATFTTANVATVMTGFPSVNYATHTIMHHLQDYSTIRYERGYASAIATVLFLFSLFANKLAQKFIGRIGK